MTKIDEIPLTSLQPLGDAELTPRADAALLITDPQQWAFSARASFDLPGIADSARVIRIGVEVERGILGVGWLTKDGTDWVTRTSASAGAGVQDLVLELPAGTTGGGLVFDNWTRGDRSARVLIHRIEIIDVEKPVRMPVQAPVARTQE